jgi:DNA-binding NarL/FixJ family response regulator
MTMRGTLEGPGTAQSAGPNSQYKGGVAGNVTAGTANLPVPVRSVLTLVILSDVRFLQEALAEILGREAGLAVIGTAANLVEARTSWSDIHPDMVLLDTTLPDALAAVALIRELLPKTRVIALAMAETEDNVIKWGEAGVASYIPRTADMADVIVALGNTMRGEQACSASIAARLLHRLAEHPAPSPASEQPLLLIRLGCS